MDAKSKLVLVCVLLLATVIRLYNIDLYGLWIDEEATVIESHGIYDGSSIDFNNIQKNNTYENVLKANANTDSGNGILHISLLHFWFKIMPLNEFNLRLPSLFFGVLLVYIIYSMVFSLISSRSIAMLCALLSSVHPVFIAYSQEGRPYMMAIFFSFMSTFFYYKLVFKKDERIKNILLYALCAAAAFFSHYLMVYVLLVHGLFAIIMKLNKKQYLYLFSAALFVGLLFFVWLKLGGDEGLEFMQKVNEDYHQKSLKDPDNSFYGDVKLTSIVQGWTQIILYTTGNFLQYTGIQLRFLIPFIIFPVFIFGFVLFKEKIKEKRQEVLFFTSLFFMGPVFATILAFKAGHNISFAPGYSIFSCPYFILIIAYYLKYVIQSQRKIMLLFPLVLTIGILLFSMFVDHPHPGQKEKDLYCEVINVVERDCNENKNIQQLLFQSHKDRIILNLYLESPKCVSEQTVDETIKERGIIRYSDGTQKIIQ